MPGSCTVAQLFYFLFYWLVWETVDKWKHFGQLITMFSCRWAWHAQGRSVGGEVTASVMANVTANVTARRNARERRRGGAGISKLKFESRSGHRLNFGRGIQLLEFLGYPQIAQRNTHIFGYFYLNPKP